MRNYHPLQDVHPSMIHRPGMRVAGMQISLAAEAISAEDQPLSLLGYLIDDRYFNGEQMQNYINGNWALYARVQHYDMNFFVIRFLCKNDLLAVLDNGPYAVHGGLLILRRWYADDEIVLDRVRIMKLSMDQAERNHAPMYRNELREMFPETMRAEGHRNSRWEDDEGDDDYHIENLDNGGQEDMDIGEGTAENQHDGPPPGEHGAPHENDFHNGSSHSSSTSTGKIERAWGIFCNAQHTRLLSSGEEEDGNQSVEQVKEMASQGRLTEIRDNTEEMFQLEEQASQYFSRLYMAGEKINQVEENIILNWPLMLDPTIQTLQDRKLMQMKGKDDNHSSGPRTELNHSHTQRFKRKGKSFQEKKYGRMQLASLKQTEKHLSMHTPHERHRTLDRLNRWKRAHGANQKLVNHNGNHDHKTQRQDGKRSREEDQFEAQQQKHMILEEEDGKQTSIMISNLTIAFGDQVTVHDQLQGLAVVDPKQPPQAV
ncbi:OLC1v1015661C1 [Oldenlandia corymbosa var. corymbosa]|uniref:OLC1v1015661C1 n=1 Tax=Oldenlandia corymbosa var. corymbosa TaxID=529605 RepID=A0AAV1E486_OLDCO|nr:OLC1v1015661C1 [Oldenlandia corymbosa var. corymbosa]